MTLAGGIGPQDQLEIVASSKDGETFIDRSEWINLPVGYNLIDHLNTDLIIEHPDVVFYDFYEAWYEPPEDDRTAYLDRRSGILAQAAPNIGPMVRHSCILVVKRLTLLTRPDLGGNYPVRRKSSPVPMDGSCRG